MNELIIFTAQYLYLIIVIVALVFVIRQSREERLRVMLCMALALPLTYIVSKIASVLYYDPRPFVVTADFVPLLAHAADNGFPSDHTLFASALAAVISIFQRWLGLGLFVVAFLVGAARVAAGVHHFVDIFGSMFIAAAVTYFVWRFVLPRAWALCTARYPSFFTKQA